MSEDEVEDMSVEIARTKLPQWLRSAATLSRFRAMDEPVAHLDNLCQRAYELLGEAEYKKIYEQTVYEATGKRSRSE